MSAMRGSIFAVPVDAYTYEAGTHPRPLDAEGNPISGYIRVTDADLPIPADEAGPTRHVLYAASGMPLFADAIPGGYDATAYGPWTPAQLVAAYPVAHLYVMDRAYAVIDPLSGEIEERRQKMARALPLDALEVLEEHIVGFHWTDDSPAGGGL